MKIPNHFLLISIIILTSCTSKVSFNDPSCPKIDIAQVKPKLTDAENIRSCDMAAEREVADQSLVAWRLALAHQEAPAMKILTGLEEKYPKMTTIDFMIGQVEEYCGKNGEAVKYYKKSVKNCEFNSLHLFKLANSLLNNHKPKEAILYYRKLIEKTPKFAPAHLGLAKALLESKSTDTQTIKNELNQVLQIEPDNIEAKALLTQINQ